MARSWFSKSFGPIRIIASPTGIRPAIRTKHAQISTRSAFLHIGPFKWFAPIGKRRRG